MFTRPRTDWALWARLRRGFLVAATVGLAACNLPSSTQLSPVSPGTMAARTVEAAMTRESSRMPELETLNAPATNTAAQTLAPTESESGLGNAENCINRAAFVDDITVRDNAQFPPGQEFVKIWRLENAGDCTWNQAYALAFFGGNRMGASAFVPLMGRVSPGERVDVAVDMVAPPSPGTFQGFRKLRDDQGGYFGIGPQGDQSFWVKIHVMQAPTATGAVASATPSPRPSATPSRSATPSPTAAVHQSGAALLSGGTTFDFDAGALDPLSGADVRFEAPSVAERRLVPIGGALLGLYAPPPDQPDKASCANTPLSSTAIALDGVSAGAYVCFQTDENRTGFLRLVDIDDPLQIEYTTWTP